MKQSDLYPNRKENSKDELFEELKKENYDDTFSNTELWLRKISSQNSFNTKTKNQERILINMKNYISSHKAKLAYTFILLAFIAAACNYPVTQEETLGDVISWTVEKNNTDAVEKINQLSWTKDGQLSVSEKNINGNSVIEYNLILSKDKHGSAESYRNQLSSIQGVNSVKLVSLNEKITRPVYSAALNKVFKVDINATDMSNDELKKEVTSQLEKNGISGVQIEFENGKDGRRISRVFIPEHSIKEDGGFDMTIKDGNNEERIKQVRKKGSAEEMERFKGKSDEEIKKMLMEELKDKGITEDMIQIKRDGDKVMFNIKIEKGDKDKKFEFEGDMK